MQFIHRAVAAREGLPCAADIQYTATKMDNERRRGPRGASFSFEGWVVGVPQSLAIGDSPGAPCSSLLGQLRGNMALRLEQAVSHSGTHHRTALPKRTSSPTVSVSKRKSNTFTKHVRSSSPLSRTKNDVDDIFVLSRAVSYECVGSSLRANVRKKLPACTMEHRGSVRCHAFCVRRAPFS